VILRELAGTLCDHAKPVILREVAGSTRARSAAATPDSATSRGTRLRPSLSPCAKSQDPRAQEAPPQRRIPRRRAAPGSGQACHPARSRRIHARKKRRRNAGFRDVARHPAQPKPVILRAVAGSTRARSAAAAPDSATPRGTRLSPSLSSCAQSQDPREHEAPPQRRIPRRRAAPGSAQACHPARSRRIHAIKKRRRNAGFRDAARHPAQAKPVILREVAGSTRAGSAAATPDSATPRGTRLSPSLSSCAQSQDPREQEAPP
jgi:hypothetical protein